VINPAIANFADVPIDPDDLFRANPPIPSVSTEGLSAS
jgi:hypothetical protein